MKSKDEERYEIDICNRQSSMDPAIDELKAALLTALRQEQVATAVLSVSIVDNPTIHRLNREHLQHDYPTDVISFALEMLFPDREPTEAEEAAADDPESAAEGNDSRTRHTGPQAARGRAAGSLVEGEIIASAEMACQMAGDGRWSPLSELKLYLIHGMLHLCGYDDQTPEEQRIMRAREREIMSSLGLEAIYAEDSEPPDEAPGRTPQ